MSRKINLFHREIEAKFLLQVLAVPIILALLFAGVYFLEPTIIGFVTVTERLNYTDTVNLEFTESGEYIWNLENLGDLRSIKIDGSKSEQGTARVYLEKDGVRYLVFDSEQLVESSSGIFGITGFAVNQGQGNNPNRPPTWDSDVDSFTVNQTLTIDLNDYFDDKDDDALTYTFEDIADLEISLESSILTIINENNIEGTRELEITADDSDKTKKKKVDLILIEFEEVNNAPMWNSEVDSFSLNGTLAVDLSLYFYDEDGDSLIYSTSNVTDVSISISDSIVTLIPDDNIDETKQITFVAYDGSDIAFKTASLIIDTTEEIPINDTLVNETPINDTPINETPTNDTVENIIDINLDYGDNEVYDANNDGVESLTGIIDFTTQNTVFNWDVDESKLCTRYEVYSIENEESTFLCYGDSECCAFVGLQNSREYWDDTLYMTYGSYGGAENNVVSAQVLNVDYDLSAEVPYSDIVYSEWDDLTAKFVKDIVEFEDACVDTCLLLGFNESSYKLIIEIENTTLRIDRIKYSIEKEVYEDVTEPEENVICKEFEDNVLWTSGYTYDKKGSTNYQTWNIGTNCTEAGGYNCTLREINVSVRSINADPYEINASGETYIQISDPDESICDDTSNADYSRYLAYENLIGADIKKGWYCGKNKNLDSKCAVEVTSNFNDNVNCYGVKLYSSQYFLIDVFEVKYTWCWDSTYTSKNQESGVNYG